MAFYDQASDITDVQISSGWDSVADFGVLARGYASAAERALKGWSGGSRRADLEAYPVLFLYRHALELSLKHILYRAFELSRYHLSCEVEEKFLNDHNLHRVWVIVKKTLDALFPENDLVKSIEGTVSMTCTEISELDPGSYTFRYPMDTNGKPTPEISRQVNLSAFAERLRKLLENLDTLGFALSAEVSVAEDAFTEIFKTYYEPEVHSDFR